MDLRTVMDLRTARFSQAARQAYPFAHQEAVRLDHSGVAPEHLLDALLREPDTGSVRIVEAHGVDPAGVRRALSFELVALPVRGKPGVRGFALETPALRQVFEQAVQEAHALDGMLVETGHLLLGLLAFPDSVAGRILLAHGLTGDSVRGAFRNVAGDPSERVLTLRALQACQVECEQRFGVRIQPEALTALAERELLHGGGAQHRARRALQDLAVEAQRNGTPRLPKDLRDLLATIDWLRGQKEGAVAEQDFERAAHLRDQADKLKRKVQAGLLWLRERNDPAVPVVDVALVTGTGG